MNGAQKNQNNSVHNMEVFKNLDFKKIGNLGEQLKTDIIPIWEKAVVRANNIVINRASNRSDKDPDWILRMSLQGDQQSSMKYLREVFPKDVVEKMKPTMDSKPIEDYLEEAGREMNLEIIKKAKKATMRPKTTAEDCINEFDEIDKWLLSHWCLPKAPERSLCVYTDTAISQLMKWFLKLNQTSSKYVRKRWERLKLKKHSVLVIKEIQFSSGMPVLIPNSKYHA